ADAIDRNDDEGKYYPPPEFRHLTDIGEAFEKSHAAESLSPCLPASSCALGSCRSRGIHDDGLAAELFDLLDCALAELVGVNDELLGELTLSQDLHPRVARLHETRPPKGCFVHGRSGVEPLELRDV